MRLWVGTIIWVLLGIATLIPAQASKANFVGYESFCTWVPVSTLILFAFSALNYRGVRKKMRAQSS